MRIGLVELIVIIVIAIVVIKPDKIGDIAKSFAKAMKGYKNAKADIQEEIKPVIDPVNEIVTDTTEVVNDIKEVIK